MDYLTECTVWRLPLFPGNPTTCRLHARGLLALFWFERGQNTRCFWPTLPVSSGYRPQQWASTLHIRKNSKRARAKATASCTSGRQCLRPFRHLVWLLGPNTSSVLSFFPCPGDFCIIMMQTSFSDWRLLTWALFGDSCLYGFTTRNALLLKFWLIPS